MLDGYSIAQLAIVALIVFGAFLVRGVSGFGTNLVAIPLLVFVLPIHTAVPMMGLLVSVLFVFLTIRDWRRVVWEELKRLVPTVLLGVAAGAVLFTSLDNVLLLKLLGLFIMGYAAYTVVVHHFGLPQVTCPAGWAYPAGFVSGCVDTMFGGGGGTLVVAYLHLRGTVREHFRATVAVLWFVETIARLAGYAVAGHYTVNTLLLCLALLPLVWVGTHLGERIGERVSQETFTRVLAVLLFLAGAGLVLR